MAEDPRNGVPGWLGQLEPRTRAEVDEVARLIAAVDPRLHRAIKWGRLTFAVEDNWHHWLCGIAVTKKTNALVLHKGCSWMIPNGCSPAPAATSASCR